MRTVLSSKQMKIGDSETIHKIGIPSMVLMERAALKVVEEIIGNFDNHQRIAVLCGSGNNGGDGLVVSRLLCDRGYQADVYLCMPDSKASDDFMLQLEILKRYPVKIYALKQENEIKEFEERLQSEYQLVVDAIFGVGLNRMLSDKVLRIVRLINQYRDCYRVIAVDVPTGLDSDTAAVYGDAVKSDITVALAFIKSGLVLSNALNFVGRLVVADIGIQERFFSFSPDIFCNAGSFTNRLPLRKKTGHKGDFGRILIVAGNEEMSGACYLAAKSAFRMGAGLVYVLTHSENVSVLKSLLPECIVSSYHIGTQPNYEKIDSLAASCDAALIGCGMGLSDLSCEVMAHFFVHFQKQLVVDADGINLLARMDTKNLHKRKAPFIITPHLGEYSRLIDIDVCEIQNNMLFYSRIFSQEYPCVSVIKSASTIVSIPEKSFINTLGNSGMATGGSGDVLAGMMVSALGQAVAFNKKHAVSKEELWELACSVTELHSLAGDRAAERLSEHSLMAKDIIEHISEALKLQRGDDEKRDDKGKGNHSS